MEYRYIRCNQDNVQALLEPFAEEGWRVHTFHVSGALAHLLLARRIGA